MEKGKLQRGMLAAYTPSPQIPGKGTPNHFLKQKKISVRTHTHTRTGRKREVNGNVLFFPVAGPVVLMVTAHC